MSSYIVSFVIPGNRGLEDWQRQRLRDICPSARLIGQGGSVLQCPCPEDARLLAVQLSGYGAIVRVPEAKNITREILSPISERGSS